MSKILDLRRTKLSAAKKFFKASPVVIIMAGLVVAGVASATIVSYLANDVIVDGNVASPIKMSVNEGDVCTDTGNKYLYFSSFGGDDYTYSTVSVNQSSNDVTGYNVTVNEQTDGGMLTGEECTEVWATVAGLGSIDVLNYIYVVHSDGSMTQLVSKVWNNPKLVTTVCIPGQTALGCGDCTTTAQACLSTIDGGDTECATTKLVLHQANKGTYRFTGQFVDDLAKYAAEEYAK